MTPLDRVRARLDMLSARIAARRRPKAHQRIPYSRRRDIIDDAPALHVDVMTAAATLRSTESYVTHLIERGLLPVRRHRRRDWVRLRDVMGWLYCREVA
jgi:hypothetical protein